ncbi:zinc-dependent alcohol dehydrogenase [Streptomyces niveiscabiei]|uniref:Zinc-binding dehydrogenase n=1 Tax=Streptomyces niveiscabiei TaxID=164115 RepID=A0ABW9HIT2_9ACTN
MPMREMRAVIKQGRAVAVGRAPVPVPGPGELLIGVETAGVCRTDVYAARGMLACADPLVLGHEFAGHVVARGQDVRRFAPGDRVAAMPVIPCGRCRRCAAGAPECCPHHEFLGIARHGAFAEYIAVPEQVVHPLPDRLSFREGAYAEPVCAALAVLKAAIRPDQRGLVYGDNRIAELTVRVLRAAGFNAVDTRATDSATPLERDAYDYAVETLPTKEAFDELIRAVRPGGRIVLKSRPPAPVALDLTAALRKELVFEATAYATFAQSLAFLAEHEVSDLFGRTYPLERFADAFDADGTGEQRKIFLSATRGVP